MHIELTGDLSTKTFLNILKRFIARRGYCKNINSDNGTNFVGTKNELSKLLQNLTTDLETKQFLSKYDIQWHFIPARSPHFGGIWEAAVKSIKSHLIKVLSNTHLTYEQLYTVLCQIEAILNSRALTALSSDPNDLDALTPAHFLVGDKLIAIPERDVVNIPVNRLKLYEILQQITQHFWRRWSVEYLTSLQQRVKWKLDAPTTPKVGDLVLLTKDNFPVLQWKLARITQLHAGTDKVVRVVTVRTPNGIVKRSVTKISILPSNSI